ncbi:hypothetical protein KJ991_02780 [Patescibacteria group bacterium]|nr:hypothetical protein [Patescibacteria group bacterium]
MFLNTINKKISTVVLLSAFLFFFIATNANAATTIGLNITTGGALTVSGNSTLPTISTNITTLGASGTTGQILIKGKTSGTVTIQPADAAGTYTLTLPTDDGTTSQFLQTNGSGVLTWAAGNSGTVTSVGVVAPIGLSVSGSPVTASGNITLAYDIAPTFVPFGGASREMATSSVLSFNSGTGALSATTFVGALTGTASGNLTTIGSGTNGQLSYWTGTNSLTGIATTTLTATAPIALSQPISVIGSSASVLTCATASGSVTGCLSSTDWTTFNNKGAGTVTSVSVVTANGVSGSVATETSTPAITLTLGAITPTSVNGLTLTAAATGFTIAGGTTSKTLTVSNTLTLAGTDSSTLNIGTGGTLGTGAFATIANYATLADPVFTSSMVIPQGASPTVDAVGEMAFDTTDNQLLIATSTTVAVIRTTNKIFSFTLASTSPEFFNGGSLPVPPETDGYTLTSYTCYVTGGTSVVLTPSDGTNDMDAITCLTTLTSDTSISANAIATAGELMRVKVGAVTGAVNYVSFSAFGTWTRE